MLNEGGHAGTPDDPDGHTRRPYRSAVPDLLFEDVQAERIDDIRHLLEHPERIARTTPLHRLTVFATYACNLACPYCKTIVRTPDDLKRLPQRASTITRDGFAAILASLGHDTIRHLHLTGGEATLLKDLPAMVRMARDHGVGHISLTSNGTLPLTRFQALADAGLDELRVSIDARDAVLGAHMTGRPAMWATSAAHLATLAARDAAGRRVFVIANTVLSESNRHDLAAIVRFLIECGVDDVKLITAVDEKHILGDFEGAGAARAEIERLLHGFPAGAFPLLRRKLQTVFDPAAIGLERVASTSDPDWRCYIPLTERTVDGMYYYPCSVYLREGGRPLGSILESADEQRAKTVAFVRDGRCLQDDICTKYCLHCTRSFNVGANEARREEHTKAAG
jgi:MoaA/NifB/PqqE/SkfB family radical SAM enzyme